MLARKIAFLWVGVSSIAFSTLSIALDRSVALSACIIPDGSAFTDRPYNPTDVEQSFSGGNCSQVTLQQDTTFYRYYSFPPAPRTNIGRILDDRFIYPQFRGDR